MVCPPCYRNLRQRWKKHNLSHGKSNVYLYIPADLFVGKISQFFVRIHFLLISLRVVRPFIVRFNALSRSIETALQKEGIPYRMLAGVKFFDRLEVISFSILAQIHINNIFQVKDLIAYLQLIDNPSYFPAFQRACQTPPKGLGEKVSSSYVLLTRSIHFK